jgi:hypothetical protein
MTLKDNVKTVSENVVLAYFMEKSKTVKSSTLLSTYSMLKLTLNIRDGIDVTKYLKLVPFLKKKSVGYQAKKSKVLIDHGNIRSHAKRRTNQNVYR